MFQLENLKMLQSKDKLRQFVWSIAMCSISLVFLTGFSDKEKTPSDLFNEASQLIEAAKRAEQSSYREANKLYKSSLEKVNLIISGYPSSLLAKQLLNDITTLESHLKIEILPEIEKKAKAENSPIKTALLIGETTPDPAFRNSVLWNVVTHYSKSGQYEKAIEIIAEKTKRLEKVQMLFLVAERYHELKETKQAAKIMKLAYEAAIEENASPQWNGLRVSKVAQQHLKFGNTKKAKPLLQKALEMTQSIEGEELDYARKDTLRQIAVGFGMLGKKSEAKSLFDEAQKYDQDPTWHYISENYLEAGLFENALEAAKKERFAQNKAKAFSTIAVKMAKDGQRERSLEIFSMAIQSEDQKKTDEMTRNTVRELLASKIFDDNQLNHLDQLIHGIGDAGMRHLFLPDLAVAYHGAGLTEKALSLLTEASALAKKQKFSNNKTILTYAKIGKVERAISIARAQKTKTSVSAHLGELAAFLAGSWSDTSIDALIEEALQVEEPAIDSPEGFNRSSDITNLFQGVVRNYLQSGNKKRAAEVLDHMVDHLSK